MTFTTSRTERRSPTTRCDTCGAAYSGPAREITAWQRKHSCRDEFERRRTRPAPKERLPTAPQPAPAAVSVPLRFRGADR